MFIWIIAANSTADKHYPIEYQKKKKTILKMIVRLFQATMLQQRTTYAHAHANSSIVACCSLFFVFFFSNHSGVIKFQTWEWWKKLGPLRLKTCASNWTIKSAFHAFTVYKIWPRLTQMREEKKRSSRMKLEMEKPTWLWKKSILLTVH